MHTHRASSIRAALPAALLLAIAAAPLHAANKVIDGGASVSVPGSQSSPWAIDGNLTIGDSGTGSLTIDANSQVSSINGFIGYSAGSVGTVSVSGTDARWNINPPNGVIGTSGLYVGYSGNGTLNISGGGTVQITGSSAHIGYNIAGDENANGALTVSGTGSLFSVSALLTVGRIGTGSITISNGGTVSSQTAFVGTIPGDTEAPGVGTVLVTGAGSAWNTIGLTTHTAGSSVRIENGGSINASNTVTLNAGDTVVTGSGSTLSVTSALTSAGGTLTVADGGTLSVGGNFRVSASLLVEDGGKLVTTATGATSTYIGYNSGAEASLTVKGEGSEWTAAADITVSRTGAGSNSALIIAEGGKVTVNGGTGKVILAGGNNTTGTLNIGEGGAAGTLVAAEVTAGSTATSRTAQVNFTHTGTANVSTALTGARLGVTKSGSGTTILTGVNTYELATSVNEGTLLVNGSLGATAVTVASGATLGGIGSIAGVIEIGNGGVLAPGQSVGTLSVGNNVTLGAGAKLILEIDSATSYDTLAFTGANRDLTFAEGAELHLIVDALANLTTGVTFDFFTGVNNVTGLSTASITSDGGYVFEWNTGSQQLVLTQVPEPSTYAAIAGGLALLGAILRRRKQ